MRYPKEVPILEASDMCKTVLRRGERCCLMGWGIDVFGFDNLYMPDPIYKALRAVTGRANSVVKYNDRHTLAENAATWNKAMVILGYTEGNPEA